MPWYQLDTPRSSGGGGGGGGGAQLASAATHLGGYSSPRGRQPLTTGGSLVESAVDSNRPSSQAQFPVRTTSPMAVLNAGSSKTISQIMQEHSYASPRATQAGIRRSSSIAGRSSPYSPGRGLIGVGRSVTPPPSEGELTDVADELKRILGTAVETPRREPLNIQPPERPDEQSFIAPPPPTVALAPEPEPAADLPPEGASYDEWLGFLGLLDKKEMFEEYDVKEDGGDPFEALKDIDEDDWKDFFNDLELDDERKAKLRAALQALA